MTRPATDTVAPAANPVSGNVIAPAAMLAAGALLVAVGVLRFAGARNRR